MEIFILHWTVFLIGLLSLILPLNGSTAENPVPDPKGYVMYCPCMGKPLEMDFHPVKCMKYDMLLHLKIVL